MLYRYALLRITRLYNFLVGKIPSLDHLAGPSQFVIVIECHEVRRFVICLGLKAVVYLGTHKLSKSCIGEISLIIALNVNKSQKCQNNREQYFLTDSKPAGRNSSEIAYLPVIFLISHGPRVTCNSWALHIVTPADSIQWGTLLLWNLLVLLKP